MPKLKNIIPSCLRVDRAMTFFISSSNSAAAPAIDVVARPRASRMGAMPLSVISLLNRMSKYTPAVTRVEEWTRADTGVGAAMAAGSHADRGICALLVILAIMSNHKTMVDSLVQVNLKTLKLNSPLLIQMAMVRRMATSPNRLVSAVSILALNLLALL